MTTQQSRQRIEDLDEQIHEQHQAHDGAEHPDITEDNADLAEDLVDQETADAVLEVPEGRREDAILTTDANDPTVGPCAAGEYRSR
jgi:hypothetical protein